MVKNIDFNSRYMKAGEAIVKLLDGMKEKGYKKGKFKAIMRIAEAQIKNMELADKVSSKSKE